MPMPRSTGIVKTQSRGRSAGQSCSIIKSAADERAAGYVCKHNTITTVAATTFDDDARWRDLGYMGVAHSMRPSLAHSLERRADTGAIGIIANVMNSGAE